ncbi:MAG: hypothetical protein H7Y10_01475 [Flavobacterium sp.]|nr:hypothetical protein [Flavobacterium sp.]
MKTVKKLGVWMDHSIAYLIEFTSDSFKSITIESEFSRQDKIEALAKSESLMHNKEKQHLSSYYKKLAEVIKDYNEVVLFGPTDAKVELFAVLSQAGEFGKIKIEIKNTDKMTENQKTAFVKDYFSKA